METLPTADYDIHDSKFFLISSSPDGVRWNDDEVAEKTPIPRVRELLGGRWESSKSYGTFAKAFFNGQKRVLVLGFHPDKTREFVMEQVQKIREGREDRH